MLLKVWGGIILLLVAMLLASPLVYKIWIGESLDIPFNLSLSMAIYFAILTFNMVFVNFINGIGKLKLQIFTSTISLIINIPLSIFLAKSLDLGTSGVILATCFSLLYAAILRPIQYYKIINNKATGIWNA